MPSTYPASRLLFSLPVSVPLLPIRSPCYEADEIEKGARGITLPGLGCDLLKAFVLGPLHFRGEPLSCTSSCRVFFGYRWGFPGYHGAKRAKGMGKVATD